MKTNFLLLLALLSLALMPAAAMAAMHDHGAAPEANAMPGHEMPAQGMNMGHEMPGGHVMPGTHEQMIMLGDQVVDGIKADAHLNDVKEAMAKIGLKETHHLMVLFQEAETGKAVPTGTAALKIKGPDNVESAAIPLMGMDGHFGADIILGAPGMYTFTIGTKLADGKTRQFEFSHELK
jgi:hypothetical protein